MLRDYGEQYLARDLLRSEGRMLKLVGPLVGEELEDFRRQEERLLERFLELVADKPIVGKVQRGYLRSNLRESQSTDWHCRPIPVSALGRPDSAGRTHLFARPVFGVNTGFTLEGGVHLMGEAENKPSSFGFDLIVAKQDGSDPLLLEHLHRPVVRDRGQEGPNHAPLYRWMIADLDSFTAVLDEIEQVTSSAAIPA
jgi:hypothetical protein